MCEELTIQDVDHLRGRSITFCVFVKSGRGGVPELAASRHREPKRYIFEKPPWAQNQEVPCPGATFLVAQVGLSAWGHLRDQWEGPSLAGPQEQLWGRR